MGPQSPQYHGHQAYLTFHSRAGWSRSSHSLGRGSGVSWGAACLLPQPAPVSQGQAGPQQPRSERSQERATCTHTCTSHVSNTLRCARTITHAGRSHTAHPHGVLTTYPGHAAMFKCMCTPVHVQRKCRLTHVHSLPHTPATTGTRSHELLSPQDHTRCRV